MSTLLVILAFPAALYAQTGSLTGMISESETGDPLPGANVLILELNTGSATALDGTYTIRDLPAGTYTVRVTFVGYKASERSVSIGSGVTTEDFMLANDFTGLEEVVVTGIASATSKARAEVAVSAITTEGLLEQNAYQDVSQLLNGKISGVTVQPASGNVGGGIRFVMRSSTGLNGDGQPVIYVDGVRIDNAQVNGFGAGGQGVSMLANLNPEDIQSVEVLKGPAGAALYGTSGSNGVVLITTKRGRLAGGERPYSLTYKAVYGANQQADEYTKFNAGSPETANAFFNDGAIVQHTVGFSGGSERVRYFASYDLRDEKGHINNNAQNRQSFRANFEAFPAKNVTLRANTGYSINDINRPQNDNNIFGYLGNTLLARAPFNFTDSTALENIVNLQRIARFTGGVEAEYRPIEALTFRASVGFDGTDLRNDASYPSNLSYSGRTNGERNIFNRRNEQYTYDFNGRYSYQLGEALTATTILGSQSFNRILRSFQITKQNFSTELITNVGAGADFIGGDEAFTHAREAGVYLQQELAYQNWLFVTLGLRRDFATAIGADAPSIYYPKASFAVRVDELTTLPQSIDFFKFRAAYGETGQLPGLLDASLLRWQAEPSGYGAGAVTNFIGNIEIEPERIRELESGIELGLFNDRLGLDVTGYIQRAENSIIGFQNPPSSGQTASSVPFNVGASDGWGIETSLRVDVIRTRNTGVDFGFLWNYQENEVKDLGGAQPIFDGFDLNVTKEGLAQSAFYTWSSRAIFNSDGSYAGAELVQTDADGDGEVDRALFGLPYPKHNGSFSLNVRFLKNFTFNGLIDWSLGYSLYNNTAVFQTLFGANYNRNVARVQIGQITPESVGLEDAGIVIPDVGTDAYRAAAEIVASTQTAVNGVSTDGNYIEEADFLKLREVSLRYDFTDILRKANATKYIRSLSFSLAARNLWTTTKYSGADPEVNFAGARSASRGQDFLTLPQPRVIYGSINIGF
ncbi:MAG: TonB-dependent receptor [Rhodothermales bacterium]